VQIAVLYVRISSNARCAQTDLKFKSSRLVIKKLQHVVKYVAMVQDTNMSAMMEIQKMETVAVAVVM